MNVWNNDWPIGFWALALCLGLLAAIWLLKLVVAKYFFRLDERNQGEMYYLIGALLKSLSAPLVVIWALYAGSLGLQSGLYFFAYRKPANDRKRPESGVYRNYRRPNPY